MTEKKTIRRKRNNGKKRKEQRRKGQQNENKSKGKEWKREEKKNKKLQKTMIRDRDFGANFKSIMKRADILRCYQGGSIMMHTVIIQQ